MSRSIEQSQERLDLDLSWRKREISDWRLFVQRSERPQVFRAGLVILCAHWEGFLKAGIDLYIDHIRAQALPIRDLLPTLVAVAFFGDVRKAAEAAFPCSEDHHIRLAVRIQEAEAAVWMPTWSAKVEGNPGSELLGKLLGSVGLDCNLGLDPAVWSTTKVFIDEQIVRDRHLVAHGEGFRVERREFLDRASRLLSLLDQFKALLVSAVASKAYLKK